YKWVGTQPSTTLTPPPFRGRMGGGISRQAKQKMHNISIRKNKIPHPNPPLKGEGTGFVVIWILWLIVNG
ncbi:hypothetical protein, partial [Vibrio cholerae]|uniref:hypothetical protein n=1 Tax=Vibrio cholerae TaxID=666 RepID=UPI001962DCAC